MRKIAQWWTEFWKSVTTKRNTDTTRPVLYLAENEAYIQQTYIFENQIEQANIDYYLGFIDEDSWIDRLDTLEKKITNLSTAYAEYLDNQQELYSEAEELEAMQNAANNVKQVVDILNKIPATAN